MNTTKKDYLTIAHAVVAVEPDANVRRRLFTRLDELFLKNSNYRSNWRIRHSFMAACALSPTLEDGYVPGPTTRTWRSTPVARIV